MFHKEKTLDEFVGEIVIDCIANLPENPVLDVFARCVDTSADGSRGYCIEFNYSGRKKLSHRIFFRLDRGEKPDDYARIAAGMLGRYRIDGERKNGRILLNLRLLAAKNMSAGIVADILGKSTADVVNAYRRYFGREPVGECMSFVDVYRIAQLTGVGDADFLKKLRETCWF